MDHNGRTEAGFVGEDAALHAPLDRQLDAVADHAAGRGLHAECAFEDRLENRNKLIDMQDEDRDRTDHIQNDHERNDLLLKTVSLSCTVSITDKVARIREDNIGNSLNDQLFELP